jgi:hypothetical protein
VFDLKNVFIFDFCYTYDPDRFFPRDFGAEDGLFFNNLDEDIALGLKN